MRGAPVVPGAAREHLTLNRASSGRRWLQCVCVCVCDGKAAKWMAWAVEGAADVAVTM